MESDDLRIPSSHGGDWMERSDTDVGMPTCCGSYIGLILTRSTSTTMQTMPSLALDGNAGVVKMRGILSHHRIAINIRSDFALTIFIQNGHGLTTDLRVGTCKPPADLLALASVHLQSACTFPTNPKYIRITVLFEELENLLGGCHQSTLAKTSIKSGSTGR